MNTKKKTTEQLAQDLATTILNMPLGSAPQLIAGMIGGFLEAVRCENIPAKKTYLTAQSGCIVKITFSLFRILIKML